MATIKGIDKLTSRFPNVKLRDFRLIKILKFSLTEEGSQIECLISNEEEGGNLEILLRFYDVSGIKIIDLQGKDSFIQGFDIKDIRDRGWEGINWQVIDYEDDRINWYSKEAELIHVACVK